MIKTNDKKIYQKLKTLTWLGVEKTTFERVETEKYTWDYDILQSKGIKAYMNDLTAVICLGQLRRLKKTNAKRRAIQAAYNKAFKGIKEIKIPQHSHTVQYYTMQCERRDKLSDHLASNNIATSVHFKPLSEMTYWKRAIKRPIPVTDSVWKKLLTLPVHNALTHKQQEKIISCVKEFYEV